MCSEQFPKEFEKSTEVLPFTKYGLTSYKDFKKLDNDIQELEWLKKAGLTEEEIKLYQENEAGTLDQHKKVESSILKSKLDVIYKKIDEFHNEAGSSQQSDETNSTEKHQTTKLHKNPMISYPEGHPMNEIKEMEDNLFGHLKNDMTPINKRRKMLRRLERKKERILAQGKQQIPSNLLNEKDKIGRPGSLWDVKEPPKREVPVKKDIIGPKKQTLYTIKDNQIVCLQPTNDSNEDEYQAESDEDEYHAESDEYKYHAESDEYEYQDIVLPVNQAEEQLLEGTKMCVDDIRKIERFKDYEPGIPSKVLYIKNIAASVTQDQLSILFNQFLLDNGGPIDVRLMSGRMRGQAFVTFQSDDVAIRALDEVNGTIVSGQPLIVQFSRN